MKSLTFDTDKYNIIYESMFLAGSYKGSQVITAMKIFNKLESIGVVRDGLEGQQGLYTLNLHAPSSTLDFEDAEFSLIQATFENTNWGGKGARKAGITFEWLTSLNNG